MRNWLGVCPTSLRASTGELSLLQRIASGGEVPWGMAIHRSGKWLPVAHQCSGTVNVFSIDTASGQLTNPGQSAATATAVSVTFVP